jgi:hypothetical protein
MDRYAIMDRRPNELNIASPKLLLEILVVVVAGLH